MPTPLCRCLGTEKEEANDDRKCMSPEVWVSVSKRKDSINMEGGTRLTNVNVAYDFDTDGTQFQVAALCTSRSTSALLAATPPLRPASKAKRRKTVGTGRCRYLKDVSRRFKNGFQTGTPKGARGPASKSE
ncbi:hypothetical protein C2857_006483 [Epichloe festucae Fl1]|uniref:Uncharacterized protein n=1 Tax=Epichloe festucae (strain Fl1) TaxID=877507 RepID=A0A7S9PSQ0_EPIFF|nr:hypothetical protein C2857_006483 [Epichloe festucae Fl1]